MLLVKHVGGYKKRTARAIVMMCNELELIFSATAQPTLAVEVHCAARAAESEILGAVKLTTDETFIFIYEMEMGFHILILTARALIRLIY
jgi:hypothetical protein